MGVDVDSVWAAFIIVLDLVAFSERDQADQIRAVRYVVEGLMTHEYMQNRAANQYYLNSTGDGFVLATQIGENHDQLKGVCALARDLVAHAAKYPSGPLGVRIGLHTGEMVFAKQVQGSAFAVGVGINWCARVADLAGPNQVLVTSELAELVRARYGSAAAEEFVPDLGEAPFVARVKHGKIAHVRAMGGAGLSTLPPPRLRDAEIIGRHIENALQILANSFVAALRRPNESTRAAEKRLVPRLTVWAPHDGMLHPIHPRVVRPPPPVAPPRIAASTRWRLRGASGGPEGPIARAYVSGRPESLLNLPDPGRQAAAYMSAWTAEGVDRQTVGGFSRHARAVLAVPLPLLERPSGVLCIDFAVPLRGQEQLVNRLMETVLYSSGYFLGSLLLQRAA